MEGVSGAQGQNGAKVIKAALVTLPLTQVKSLYRWTRNLFGFILGSAINGKKRFDTYFSQLIFFDWFLTGSQR